MSDEKCKENGKLLLGACGAISVVHLCMWVTFLRMSLCGNIHVILTKQAAKMINPWSISQFTQNPTYTDFFSEASSRYAPHVALPTDSDLFVILPATANILGKAANGIADDILSSAILNSSCPTVFVPHMNLDMWNKKSVQRNVSQLQEDGYHIFYEVLENFKISTGNQSLGVGMDLHKLIIKLKRLI